MICKEIENCDAGIYYEEGDKSYSDTLRKYLLENGLRGEYLPLQEQHRFKILIDIDGIAFSARFPSLLRLGAAVFKVEGMADAGNIGFEPWVHYVPIRSDLTDLEAKLKWALDNDNELEKIALRGQRRAREVDTKQTYACYMIRLLRRYHELLLKGGALQ